MESTISVSKGVFLFKNGFNKSKGRTKNKATLFSKQFKQDFWHTSYLSSWHTVESQIMELNNKSYSYLLSDMVNYIKSFSDSKSFTSLEGVIPSATLLTGVNQPDHASQFAALVDKIREEVTPHIAMAHSQDSPTIQHLVETVVWQLVNGAKDLEHANDSMECDSPSKKKKLRKNQCTMSLLKDWYNNSTQNNKSSPKKRKRASSKGSLVIILPDFESFNCGVLQDFVIILSSYVSSLPIILVFGVATSVSALHKSFPYHVSSKLLIKVFHSHSSPVYMNQVLENVFLTHDSSFHLSGKALQLLVDVFLFYDFSVTGLIQSIKYCMMDHFYGDNIKALCCDVTMLDEIISKLSTVELEQIRQLPSFRPHLESQDCRTKISLFQDDSFFREKLHEQILNLHEYMFSFYASLKIFSALVKDLPKNVLGKTIRELYTKCASEYIIETPEFRESMQLLGFQSQTQLVESINDALKVCNTVLQNKSPVKPLSPMKSNIAKDKTVQFSSNLGEDFIKNVRVHLLTFLRHIENANSEATVILDSEANADLSLENTPGSRYKLKEKLLKATKVDRVQSEYEMVRARFVAYLEEMFAKSLRPPKSQTFHELFFFNNVAGVKKQIIGSPRGAIHTALSNPEHYLQCKCCVLSHTDSVLPTLPSSSVAYKLHRECGRLINLLDWLYAFVSVLVPAQENDSVPPKLQAQFTHAVAELQFLGFIKSSKRKTDHVMRLTW